MPYIYAIIREKETGKLKYVKEQYNYAHIEDSVLCDFFNYNYATSLSETYCYLPEIPAKSLDRNTRSYRQNAYLMQQAIDEFKKKNDVVAFSHRYNGFKYFDWNLNDDITFHIDTNFGFGSKSFFDVTFMYKDVKLTPYSYYVKYRKSDYDSVVRCTYCYYPKFEEWERVMKDCIDFYDAVVNGTESYVFEWIQKQIETMIDELNKIVFSSSYTFYDERHNVNKVSKMTTLTNDDFWIIKAEKIANSLEFIKNLEALPTQIEADKYSTRLLEIAETFVPMLSEKISAMQKKVSIEEDKLRSLKMKGNYPLYLRIKEEYYYKKQWFSASKKFSMIRFLMKLLNRLYPQYCLVDVKQRLKALDALIKKIDDTTSKLNIQKRLLNSLEESFSTLTANLKEYNR